MWPRATRFEEVMNGLTPEEVRRDARRREEDDVEAEEEVDVRRGSGGKRKEKEEEKIQVRLLRSATTTVPQLQCWKPGPEVEVVPQQRASGQ